MRSVARCLLLVAGIAALAVPGADAQTYPTRPIRLIVGYGPGGVADITARLVAQKMSEILGEQILIDNRPGAGQVAAGEAVARATPDGYTLLSLNNGNAISAALFKKLPFDMANDFEPIAPFGFFGIFILINNKAPYTSVKDMLDTARKAPQNFNIGTTSVGSTQNLAAELMKSVSGVPFTIVPFKTTGELLTALERGDLQAVMESPATTQSFIKDGRLKALAITTPERQKTFPDVPTVAESGLPGYDVVTWNALAAPAKTPRAIIAKLNAAALKGAADPDVQARFEQLGIETRNQTPEEVKALFVHDIAKWRQVIE
ncbi:MAG: tripartite tricarboxylate transporter substrate binding protein, partial [Alphaproteobacteria bacterium]|nr:tripartite tricarboxylate transporter substrate binding protein [Alphaproteobacteria bacterium]